jgi:hypothetical protein
MLDLRRRSDHHAKCKESGIAYGIQPDPKDYLLMLLIELITLKGALSAMLPAKASLRRHLPTCLRRRQRPPGEKSLVNPHLTPSCTQETLEKTVAELPITQSWNHDPQGSHFFPMQKLARDFAPKTLNSSHRGCMPACVTCNHVDRVASSS